MRSNQIRPGESSQTARPVLMELINCGCEINRQGQHKTTADSMTHEGLVSGSSMCWLQTSQVKLPLHW